MTSCRDGSCTCVFRRQVAQIIILCHLHFICVTVHYRLTGTLQAHQVCKAQAIQFLMKPGYFQAVWDGDVGKCAEMLQQGASAGAVFGRDVVLEEHVLNSPDRSACMSRSVRLVTPLFVAAMRGSCPVCQLLLDHGAEHAPNGDGDTPLSIAAQSGHVDVCALLLDRGATHAANTDGATPLFVAAEEGHAQVCGLLLDRGATHEPVFNGVTPLIVAAQRGHQDVCKVLLDRGAEHVPMHDGMTPLAIAALKGHHQVCAVLLDRGATHASEHTGATPLLLAAQEGHVKVCELLLHRGATHAADENGFTPLFAAAQDGYVQVCKTLLNRGATHAPSKNGTTPLYIAVMNGHKDVCELLLDRGATHDPEWDGWTPLTVAALKGRADLCALLLDRGARHVANDMNRTPLYYAVSKGHVEACKLLLGRGALEVVQSATFSVNTSAFYIAADKGYTDVLKVLLDHDALEKDVPPCILRRDFSSQPHILAMLVQRLSPLLTGIGPWPLGISSVCELIFFVHALCPHQRRNTVLEIVYHEIIAQKQEGLLKTPPAVLELVAFMLWKWRKTPGFYLTCGAGKGNVDPAQRAAIVKGMTTSKAMHTTEKNMPRLYPWWMWRAVVQTMYGVPVEWTTLVFWESPARPCKSPVLEL